MSAGYTDEELLAAVAAYVSQADRQTVEGYRTWARETGQPSDAWVRKRLGETYGGWPGIVHAARRLDRLSQPVIASHRLHFGAVTVLDGASG